MAHSGRIQTATSKLIRIAERKGAALSRNTAYYIATNPGAPGREVLFYKGKKTRWIELRGTKDTPYFSATPGVVQHEHESSSIRYRLDTDHGTEADVVARFSALIDNLMS
jgi:hypothetical protein